MRDKKEFLKEIRKKINEEAKELIGAKTKNEIMDELVDIQELLDTLVGEIGALKIQIRQQQRTKNKKRGGFKKRLLLIKTGNDD